MTLNVSRLDLVTFIRNNYYEKLDPVAERRVIRATENGLRMVSKAHNWAFLLDTYTFNTVDDYATGTLTIPAAGVTTWEFSGVTLPTDIATGRAFLEVNGENTWYPITTRTDADTLVTRFAYGGSTAAATASIAYKIVYPLAALPANFRKRETLRNRNGGTNPRPVEVPAAWWAHDAIAGQGEVQAYAIVQDHHDANQKMALLIPAPDGLQSYELVYWRHAGWYSSSTPATSTWKMRATADTDYVDWPEERLELLYAAILLCLWQEADTSKVGGAWSAYQQLLEDAKGDDSEDGGIRTLSDGGSRPYIREVDIPTS